MKNLKIGDKIYTGFYLTNREVEIQYVKCVAFTYDKHPRFLFKNLEDYPRSEEEQFNTMQDARDFYTIVLGRKVVN